MLIINSLRCFVNYETKTLDEIETKWYTNSEVIKMNEQWKNIIITGIGIAVYVAPNTGKHIHKTDRITAWF